jgi:hypothetical protein
MWRRISINKYRPIKTLKLMITIWSTWCRVGFRRASAKHYGKNGELTPRTVLVQKVIKSDFIWPRTRLWQNDISGIGDSLGQTTALSTDRA